MRTLYPRVVDKAAYAIGCATLLSVSFAGTAAADNQPKIVAGLHARNLDATLAMVRDYVPVPFKPESLVSEVFGDLASQVALSDPADAVLALDVAPGQESSDSPSPPLFGFAVGVRNLAEAQRIAQSRGYVTPNANRTGFTALHIKPGGRSFECLLGPGATSGSGRLSCSLQKRDLEALISYLSVAHPSRQVSDLHGELRVDTLMSVYGGPWQRLLQMAALLLPQKLQLGQPGFDRALTDATQTLTEQLQATSHDLKWLAVDLSLGKTGVEARLGYRLTGTSSWWAQADAESAAAATSGAPALFWQLPADSTSASFHTGDAKYGKKLLALLVPLCDGFLAHDGMAESDRHAISEVLSKLVESSPPGPSLMVVSSGQSPAPAAPSGGFDPLALLDGSYYLWAIEGASTFSIPWQKSLVAAYNRPGVQTYLRGKWKKLDPTGALPSLRAEVAPKNLGAGAYALSLSGNFAALSREAGKLAGLGKGRQITLHVVSVSAGGRLWTALGTDRAVLAQHLAEQQKGQVPKTLEQRGGLEALREPGVNSGGFTSLLAMSGYLDAMLLASQRRSLGQAGAGGERVPRSAQLFVMAPHHGEAPMTYVSHAGGPSGAQTGAAQGRPNQEHTSEAILRIPRLVIEDIAAMLMQLALDNK